MHVAAYFLPKNDPILPKIFLVNWHCPGSILTKFDHRLLLERLGTKIPKIPKFYLCSDMADFHRVAFSHVRCEKYFKKLSITYCRIRNQMTFSSVYNTMLTKLSKKSFLIKICMLSIFGQNCPITEEIHHSITDTTLCNG